MDQGLSAPAAAVERFAVAALAAVERSGELCIRIVDEPEGLALNERYRGRDKATNVLSFPAAFSLPEAGIDMLGDVVLCAPVVEAEASDQGKPVLDHYAHMVVHGVLHIVGYDHECETDADVMQAKETTILRGLGVPDPYRTAG